MRFFSLNNCNPVTFPPVRPRAGLPVCSPPAGDGGEPGSVCPPTPWFAPSGENSVAPGGKTVAFPRLTAPPSAAALGSLGRWKTTPESLPESSSREEREFLVRLITGCPAAPDSVRFPRGRAGGGDSPAPASPTIPCLRETSLQRRRVRGSRLRKGARGNGTGRILPGGGGGSR